MKEKSLFDDFVTGYKTFVEKEHNSAKMQATNLRDFLATLQPGDYLPVGVENLWRAGQTYYAQYCDSVRALLKQSKIDDATAETILTDYGNFLLCGTSIGLPADEMCDVVDNVPADNIYRIDKFGLHGLFRKYYNLVKCWEKLATVLNAKADVQREFLRDTHNSQALNLAVSRGYIDGDDFPEIPSVEFDAICKRNREITDFFVYGYYYDFARRALLVSDTELKAIPRPERLGEFETKIKRVWTDVIKADQDKHYKSLDLASEPVTRAVATLDDNKTVFGTMARILEKDFELYRNGDPVFVSELLEVKNGNNSFFKNSQLSKLSFNKVFDGLQNVFETVPRNGEIVNTATGTTAFSYVMSISKFAELCGYADANAEEKNKLLAVLIELQTYYVKFEDLTEKGRKRNRIREIRVVDVPELSTDDYDPEKKLTLNIPLISMGQPVAKLPYDVYNYCTGKSLPQFRFFYQIIRKQHKRFDDIVAECYSYTDRERVINNGNNDDKEKRRLLRNLHKNKARDQQSVEQWFADFKARGILSNYHIKTNDKGERVANWKVNSDFDLKQKNCRRLMPKKTDNQTAEISGVI